MAEAAPAPVVLSDVVVGYRTLFGRRTVLEGLTLRAESGAVTVLVGPNGAGKTTLLRLMAGVLRAWSGCVAVGSRSPARHRRLGGVAHLPAVPTLPGGWTVRSLLEEGAAMIGSAGRPPSGTGGLAVSEPRHLLEAMGLLAVESRRVETLSRGETRRTALAFVLLGAPRLLVLDEPWSGLDPDARRRIRKLLRSLADAGSTVVLASHDLGDVVRVADRLHVLRSGRLAATFDGPEVRRPTVERSLSPGPGKPSPV